MAKYRKKPVVIEANQWFQNGDHPKDDTHQMPEGWLTEGHIVRRFNRPDKSGDSLCEKCGKTMQAHGWVDTLEGGHIVCPGDFIIEGVQGEFYPCKPDIFEATYEPAE
jgi:hypothetical protein